MLLADGQTSGGVLRGWCTWTITYWFARVPKPPSRLFLWSSVICFIEKLVLFETHTNLQFLNSAQSLDDSECLCKRTRTQFCFPPKWSHLIRPFIIGLGIFIRWSDFNYRYNGLFHPVKSCRNTDIVASYIPSLIASATSFINFLKLHTLKLLGIETSHRTTFFTIITYTLSEA